MVRSTSNRNTTRQALSKNTQKAQNSEPKGNDTAGSVGGNPKRKSAGLQKRNAGNRENPECSSVQFLKPRARQLRNCFLATEPNEKIQRVGEGKREGDLLPPTPAITPKDVGCLCGTDQGRGSLHQTKYVGFLSIHRQNSEVNILIETFEGEVGSISG